MFDRLLLLCKGQTAYFGDVNRVLGFFQDIGLEMKPNYNPADFIRKDLFNWYGLNYVHSFNDFLFHVKYSRTNQIDTRDSRKNYCGCSVRQKITLVSGRTERRLLQRAGPDTGRIPHTVGLY